MKRLILLRHAKSSWVNPDLNDFDRPLNKRGKRGAKALGKWMRKSGWKPDKSLCSSARRARETWEGLMIDGEPELLNDLYHASPATMLKVLAGNEAETILMIGHNPGISQLAGELAAEPPDHARFADFPTGALLIAEFEIEQWSKITPHSGNVVTFLTPHDLVD